MAHYLTCTGCLERTGFELVPFSYMLIFIVRYNTGQVLPYQCGHGRDKKGNETVKNIFASVVLEGGGGCGCY